MGWLSSQFELTRGTVVQNVRSMEGIRGFAVFLVFLVHFVTLADSWIAPNPALAGLARAIGNIGNSGVDLFFLLSGYLIYGSLITRPQLFVAFMRRRIVRIYPTFTVVFTIYLYLSFLFPSESKIPKDSYDAWVYSLQNYALLPGMLDITPMITVAWSLSYEMFFYLITPIAIFLIGLRQRSPEWRIRFLLATAAALAMYDATYGGPVRLIMFIAGMLLHETLRLGEIKPPRSGFTVLAFAGGLLSALIPFSVPGMGAVKIILMAASFFITCYCCFRGQCPVLVRAFSWTPLRWLGNMSYSYYLLHGLALKAGFAVLARVLPSVAHETMFVLVLLPLMFALTLIPSMALFILVERPFSLKAHQTTVTA